MAVIDDIKEDNWMSEWKGIQGNESACLDQRSWTCCKTEDYEWMNLKLFCLSGLLYNKNFLWTLNSSLNEDINIIN